MKLKIQENQSKATMKTGSNPFKTQVIINATCSLLLLISTMTFAQDNSNNQDTFTRDGFMFEFGLGGGLISIEDSTGPQRFDDT